MSELSSKHGETQLHVSLEWNQCVVANTAKRDPEFWSSEPVHPPDLTGSRIVSERNGDVYCEC